MPTSLVRPFAGLRPVPERAAEVIAPPYDVLDSAEARQRASGKPWSFLHVSKPEIDLPPGTDVHAPEVYAKAAENLDRLVAAGVLRRDPRPCYYVYRLKMGDHVQTGVVLGASVAAYDANRIRKHEFTRPDKEDDRVRQIEAVKAQTGPVLLAHPPAPAVDEVLARVAAGTPAYDLVADDGIGHALWVIDADADIAAITEAFDAMPALYIADGHHRSASASRVAARLRAAHPDAGPEAPWESFLTVSFPKDQMLILDYNRVVRDLNGLSREDFLAKVGEAFDVEKADGPAKPAARREVGMYLGGAWRRLRFKAEPGPEVSPADRLDVALLARHLLEPVLGILDSRRDKRIDFVGGMRGLKELERRVDSGEMAVAFALFPTSMDELMEVAEAGQVMPPKSTWFEPKLADGMVSLVL
ncbi:MAG: DUF1015 family protein [Magnetospirillum sp. WYHS-4]